MRKFDDVDKRIIRILEKNAHQSSDKIARSLNVSSSTVRRRINRLIKEKVLRIQAVADPRYMGYAVAASIGLKVDNSRLKYISDYLIKKPNVLFLSLTTGRWDLSFMAWFQSIEDLSDFINTVLNPLEGIVDKEVTILTAVKKYVRPQV